jgi:serine/arginine repetitive matrix protein 2
MGQLPYAPHAIENRPASRLAIELSKRWRTSSPPHRRTAAPPHRLTASPPHRLTASQPHSLTASQPHSLTASQPHQLLCSGLPSANPAALCTPTTARS